MKISGFSFARNAQKLYYPVAESIKSILPICDEFVIAIGKGDADDRTREEVAGIGDPKVRIIDTEWTDRQRIGRKIHSQQSNIALDQCSGDWCFYIQADEVVHEADLPRIQKRCQQLLDEPKIEGLLFSYLHFWGDYEHYHKSHAWYPREIRIIRNNSGIRSWSSAQSFRKDGKKITVAPVDANIFHYGWVRPPELMRKKQREFETTHHGSEIAERNYGDHMNFSYGSLQKLQKFTKSHPAVMQPWIEKCAWKDQLQYTGTSSVVHKHDKCKYRTLTWIEQHLLGGRQLGGFKNYKLKKIRPPK